jgi:hydrogenase maturation factor HypF (carbamoyltransferase family)
VADPAVRVLPEATCARKIIVTGHVQGVGFRPFVYRLARQHGLHGSVRNQLGQVEIRACGAPHALETSLARWKSGPAARRMRCEISRRISSTGRRRCRGPA